jgi:hypothetical protein
MLKKQFCWLYEQWLSKFVDSKDDWLVKVIDATVGGKCKYCVAVRAFLLGASFCLPLVPSLIVQALVVAMTLGERYWLCLKEYSIVIEYPIPNQNQTTVLVHRTAAFSTLEAAQAWAAKEMGDVPYRLELTQKRL